jgi:hypothetical protein
VRGVGLVRQVVGVVHGVVPGFGRQSGYSTHVRIMRYSAGTGPFAGVRGHSRKSLPRPVSPTRAT